jgi:hypothetical protein
MEVHDSTFAGGLHLLHLVEQFVHSHSHQLVESGARITVGAVALESVGRQKAPRRGSCLGLGVRAQLPGEHDGAEGGPQSVLHGRSFVGEEVRRTAMETGSTEVLLKLPACCVKFFRFPAMWHISALPTGSPARDGLFAWAFSSVSAAFPAQLRFWPGVWLPGQFRIQR